MTAAIAIILFIDAFVMWLASLTGSVAVAALITGGFFAVIAAVVYLLAVRSALNYIRDRIETVYAGRFPDQGGGMTGYPTSFRSFRSSEDPDKVGKNAGARDCTGVFL